MVSPMPCEFNGALFSCDRGGIWVVDVSVLDVVDYVRRVEPSMPHFFV